MARLIITREPYASGYVPRADRRMLLVLLTGASNLSGYPAAQAAQVRPALFCRFAGSLMRAGWVTDRWVGDRRFYQLTYRGRCGALTALGLPEPPVAGNPGTCLSPHSYQMPGVDRRVLLALTASSPAEFTPLTGLAPAWLRSTRTMQVTAALGRLRQFGWVVTGGPDTYRLISRPAAMAKLGLEEKL